MTVMAMPDSRLEFSAGEVHDATSLRTRLAGQWAIVFSHPEDFTQEQLEMDRWVTVLGRSFSERGVVPVALARPQPDRGLTWLGRLASHDSAAAAILALDPPPGNLADFAAGALRAQIARGGPRFALILDAKLRCRRALSYRSPEELPSPLDLLGWAVALRKREHAGDCPLHRAQSALPIASGWEITARCTLAQAFRG